MMMRFSQAAKFATFVRNVPSLRCSSAAIRLMSSAKPETKVCRIREAFHLATVMEM